MGRRYAFVIPVLVAIALTVPAGSPRAAEPPQLSASGYLNYPQIESRIKQFAAAYPAIAQAVDLNQSLGVPLTAGGRSIWALKISDHVTTSEDEPGVIVDGLHHAREITTPHAVFDLAEILTARYGSDPEVTSWVDHYEIWLIPCLNPDGLQYVFEHDRNWRKNRRTNGNGTYGVDLNRNYVFGWGICGGTVAQPGSDQYRGPSPASESEVQTLLALGSRVRPLLYLSYHSYGQQVLYPYRCANLAEREVYYNVRDQYASAMQYTTRVASASGESFEHFYNQFGSMAFLTEIGTQFQPSYSTVASLVERIRPGWQYLLRRGMGPVVEGHVVNSLTGEPVIDAEIEVEGVNFTEGESRKPDPVFGRYQWMLPTGNYTLRFTAKGFQPESRTISVSDGMKPVEVRMTPTILTSGESGKATMVFSALLKSSPVGGHPETARQ